MHETRRGITMCLNTYHHARLLTSSVPAVPHEASAAHAAVAVAAAAGVTAARQALLGAWPEFAAASQRSNKQVGVPARKQRPSLRNLPEDVSVGNLASLES